MRSDEVQDVRHEESSLLNGKESPNALRYTGCSHHVAREVEEQSICHFDLPYMLS